MKVKKNTGEKTEMVGVEKKMEFSIDTSNQMIVSILRDKLYSNKIAAVCREVASNSRDANREAGKGDVPITIKMTQGTSILGDNSLNISFKDSGIGISPDRIENVFLKYGSSTKRNTNTQTGGFGIGAKTPFAYSKEFLISTVSDYNGKRMKHVYQAIILSENGLESSQLIAVSEEFTTEETGTEIIVPINEDDRPEFEQECVKATVLWDVQPVLQGFKSSAFPRLTNVLKGEEWRLMKGNYKEYLFSASYREVMLEVDGIPYKFDIKKINNITPDLYSTLTHSRINKTKKTYFYTEDFENFVLKFKTGELSLSASREEIEYTRENITLIAERFLKMEGEIVDTCVNSYEAIDKEFDKLLFYVSTLTESKDRVKDLYKNMEMAGYLKNNYPETNQFGLSYSSLFKNVKGVTLNYIKSSEDKLTPTKKNLITDDVIKEDVVRDSIFVIKSSLDRSNTRKNKTLKKMLRESNKTGFVFVNVSYDIFKEGSACKMFEESKIKVVDYRIVELAPLEKRERGERTSAGGNGAKVDTSVGTVFARRTANIDDFFGDKIKYNKKDFTIVEFDNCKIVEGQKIVFACLKGWKDLKDLDRTRKNVNDILDEEMNGLTIQISEDRSKIISKTALVYLLQKFNYKVFFIKKEDLDKLKGEKTAIVGLTKAYKDLLKNENFKDFVKKYNDENSISDLDLITRKDSSYEEFFKNPLGKAYISLSGIDFDKFKVYSEKTDDKGVVVRVSDEIKWGFRDDFKVIAKSLIKADKKFEGYLKEDDIKNAHEIIKKNYPLIHYMYDEIGDTTYNSYKYQPYNNGNTEGISILKQKLLQIINDALATK